MDLTVPLIYYRNVHFSVARGYVQLYRRAPNSDNGSRRCYLHVTRFGYLAGNEASGTLHKRDE
jgi:hypothetical protein